MSRALPALGTDASPTSDGIDLQDFADGLCGEALDASTDRNTLMPCERSSGAPSPAARSP